MSDSRWRLERRGRRDSIGAGRTVVRIYCTKRSTHFRVAKFFVASAEQHSKISPHALRDAGTLPRSPRIKWGAGTPDAPLQVPSGTESMLMNAALASVHASELIKTLGDTLA